MSALFMSALLRSIALAILSVLLFSSPGHATRLGFVVGISTYANLPQLKSPADDAIALGKLLTSFDFDTVVLTGDQTNRGPILLQWQKFLNRVQPGDEVVVAYSGHGVEIKGVNYFVPKDAPDADQLDGEDVLAEFLVSLEDRIGDLKTKDVRTSIFIIDACRNNPFSDDSHGRAVGGRKGLIMSDAPEGMFIFYAANARQAALDRLESTKPNSPYTFFLVDYIKNNPRSTMQQIAGAVRNKVREVALALPGKYKQFPSYNDSLADPPWCFKPCVQQVAELKYETAASPAPERGGGSGQLESVSGTRGAAADVGKPPNAKANAVYLGKASALSRCTDGYKVFDAAPFGCAVLQALVAGNAKSIAGRSLKPVTEVKVRQQAGADYCAVEEIREGQTVDITGVLSRPIAGDTYYWATLSGTPKDCPLRRAVR